METTSEREPGALDRLTDDHPVRVLRRPTAQEQQAAFTLAAQRATFALVTEPPSRYAVDNETTQGAVMAKTLEIRSVDSDEVLDRVTLDDSGQIHGERNLGRDLITSLVTSLGITPAQAFDMRADWSNGYITAKLA